jgi:DNA-binding NarL/FixJ family response regulator
VRNPEAMEKNGFITPVSRRIKVLKKPDGLSRRELVVFQLAADGFTNKEIGVQLDVTADTIDSHNRNIVKALGARNMKHAIAIGIRSKIIQ